MTDNERQLLAILKERSFRFGTFVLASGKESPYYIDGRTSAVYSAGAYFIGEVLYERTKDLEFSAIGGLEVGAVPLTTAVAISYHLHGRKIEGFWVRDEVKAHGTKKRIEGTTLAQGARVIIVDDVFTTGGSAEKAIQAVRALGCEVVQVLCLVDRLQGAEERFAQLGVASYQSVFTIRDFGVQVDGSASAAGPTR